MYSESDIDGAVGAGAITPQAAAALRDYVAARQASPAVDEEHFRLLTGFNDIFVTIALVLLLVALGQIGQTVAAFGGGVLLAAASWGLAEYFTRQRRMALPSILLLGSFVGGIGWTILGLLSAVLPNLTDRAGALGMAAASLAMAAAAWLHWRRFMVPITVAAGAAALVGTAIALLLAAVPGIDRARWPLLLIGGLIVFAVAMRWDMSDTERKTRRSDVAFWLHLTAAPMIAHSVFQLLGVFRGDIGVGMAVVVLALYIGFAVIALAVDRRALLVSGLAYVLAALYALFRTAGAIELSAALTAFVIGSALLSLSAFWQTMRRAVVIRLPDGTRRRLPPVA
ncbi:hypothetical protein [Sphingomonas sp. RIT328]|uniref:hypothetical protein n=1 Tax=Sphingomonas sp. RIT328 TaxID=1470591 RepID=UPI00044AC2FC|nr:hypothetical protein [Sphingomonas sp. RIT328]EZP51775.1 hypothetical protein BW41_02665 [Sphingomonas sp. RIT328]